MWLYQIKAKKQNRRRQRVIADRGFGSSDEDEECAGWRARHESMDKLSVN